MKRIVTLLMFVLGVTLATPVLAADSMICWFPPEWKDTARAKTITDALSSKSGTTIEPRVAASYPEIFDAFAAKEPTMVFGGSFLMSLIKARGLGTFLVQASDGKEMYGGVMIYPKGQDPAAILKESPELIAYAKGSSSGESVAKAATDGKASVSVANHGAAVTAVSEGKAKAAMVKDWWWLDNKTKFPTMDKFNLPGLSRQGNPDKVLSVSKNVSKAVAAKITEAALVSAAAFSDKTVVVPFDASKLDFSLDLMKKGKIDPKTYNW